MSRPLSESRVLGACIKSARTTQGLADQLGGSVEEVQAIVDHLLARGSLRRISTGRTPGYRAAARRRSSVTTLDERRESASQRMSRAVATVALRERVRVALAAESLTARRILEVFGPEGVTAADRLVTDGEATLERGRYRRVAQPLVRRGRPRRLVARPDGSERAA